MSSPCYVCGSRSTRLRATIDGHEVLRCDACDLSWVPRVAPALLEGFYGAGYFASADPRKGYSAYLPDEPNHRANAADLLDLIDRRWPLRGARLLDVGCAYGFLLDVARGRGARVEGVELSARAGAHARDVLGHTVHRGAVEDVALPAGAFDVVTLVGTIEHLRDPRAALLAIARALRPGGVLAVSTIDTRGPLPLYLLKPPEHLFYFSRRNLGLLLEQAGFVPALRRVHWVRYRVRDVTDRLAEALHLRPARWLGRALTALAPGASLRIPTNEMLVLADRR